MAAYLSPKVAGTLMKKELDYLGGWGGGTAPRRWTHALLRPTARVHQRVACPDTG